MSSYISFEALLRDLELYERLKKERDAGLLSAEPSDDVVSSSACSSSTVDDQPSTSNSMPTETSSNRPLSPTEPDTIPEAPSPTYSFPSEVSDDENESESEAATSTAPVEENAVEPDTTSTAVVTCEASTSTEEPVAKPEELASEEQQCPQRPLVQKPATPPTLFIPRRSRMGDLLCGCKIRNIQIKKARCLDKGVIMTASTFKDYESFTEMLVEENIPFHLYTIADKRKLRVAIHYIPSEITCFEIKESLLEQNLPVYDVTRLGQASDGTDETYDIFIAYLDWNAAGRAIFHIESICNFSNIYVEMYNGQCRIPCDRCHLYGHKTRHCYRTLKCDRCFGNHIVANCGEPLVNRSAPIANQGKKPKCSKHREEELGLYWVTRSGPLHKSTSTEDPSKVTRFSNRSVQTRFIERDVVARFFNEMDVDELLKIHKLICEHEGDGKALFLMAMEYAPLLEKLQAFKVNRQK